MKKLRWISILLSLPFLSEASPQVSGYISLKCLGSNTYQATVVDYVVGNPENSTLCDTARSKNNSIRFYWSDGTSDSLFPSNGNGDSVCDCRKEYIYVSIHTFPGPGTYNMSFDALPRAANIENMIASINQDMFIFHKLIISPVSGDSISSPVITNPPVCSYGCPSQCYNFNLGAYSPVGDNLSYSLGNCLCSGGVCAGYTAYNATINSVTGELSWCNPPSTGGIYNFSVRIASFRNVIVGGQPFHIPVDTEEVELEVTIQTNCSMGINAITNTSGEHSIYPNPSNGKFTLVETQNPDSYRDVSIQSYLEIYNILGEKVLTQTLNQVNDNTPIDLSNNGSGIYLYRVLTETGEMVSEGKFVIQK